MKRRRLLAGTTGGNGGCYIAPAAPGWTVI